MALGAKMDGKDLRVWVVTSDAEHQCGLHWEAVLTGAKFKLDNLTDIVDRNFIQIDGSTEDVMPLDPLADKYRAFNWEVLRVRRQRHRRVRSKPRERAQQVKGRPQVDHRAHAFPARASRSWKATTRGTASRPTASRPIEALRELEAWKAWQQHGLRSRAAMHLVDYRSRDSSRFQRATASAKG